MSVQLDNYKKISKQLNDAGVQLVAVSKIKPVSDIMQLYNAGQRDFGENYVQELVEKEEALPKDIRWHYIGHLQSNKVKFISPFVHMVHGVDSLKLLKEINKQADKNNRTVHCLLQVHIAQEETKFGFDENELNDAIREIQQSGAFQNIMIDGLMGMASFSDDMKKVSHEMQTLKTLYDKHALPVTNNCKFSVLSMGMSGDYKIAIEAGSNMVRIGSLLFGARI